MVMLRDLRPASFRGARFLVPRDHAEEGRVTILHQYPDSNRVYVEDNGYLPPEFTLTCILHGTNCLGQFRALRAALDTPGPGTLHHPWYGAQFVAAKKWKVKRDDRDSGVLELECCFQVTGAAVFPGVASAIAAQVTGLSAAFVAALFSRFVTAYGTPSLGVTSLSTMADTVTGVAQSFLTAFQSVSDVQSVAGHIVETPERFVYDGAVLGPALATMFRAPLEDVEQTYSGSDIVSAMSTVSGLALAGVTASAALPVSGPLATHDYQVRASALYTYSTYVALATLSEMAEAMASTTYTTVEAVEAAQAELLALYAAIPMDQIDGDTADGIQSVVQAAMDVLRQEELQLPNIGQTTINQFPASVLSYMLYDTDGKTDTLTNLNPNINPALLDGRVNILIGAT